MLQPHDQVAPWCQHHQRLARLEGGVQKEQRSNFIQVGKLLAEIWDHQLHTFKGYRSFVKYVDEDSAFKFTGKHAVRLVRTFRFIKSLPPGVNVPTSERQVRPLIKLGFNEARLVWVEAQRLGARQGKLVTGEMVADIVNRLKKDDPEERVAVRHKTGGGPKPGCGICTSLEIEPTSTGNRDTDAHPSECCQASLDVLLLLADFDALRSRANLLSEGERQKILQEWRDDIENELNSMHPTSTSMSGNKKRSMEVTPPRSTGLSCSEPAASEESAIQNAATVSHFSCKRRRTGFRKPRTVMPRFQATSGISYDQDSAGRSTGKCLIQGKLCECSGTHGNCRGLGLLLSAANFVSK